MGYKSMWRQLAGLVFAIVLASFGSTGQAFAGGENDQFLLTQVGLMRGHLRMAEALEAANLKSEASLHYHHPLKELYDDIKDELTSRGITDLGDALKALEKADESGADVKAPLKIVFSTLDLTEGSITASPKMMLLAVVGLLKHAAEEYAVAYTPAGKLDKQEEYQDSWGFTTKASDIFTRIRLNLAKRDPGPIRDIAKKLTIMQTAWPNLEGPQKPVIDGATVSKVYDEIEQIASKYRG